MELADKLGKLSGYTDYSLFFMQLWARLMKMLRLFIRINPSYLFNAFHGRTSAAVATDNKKNCCAYQCAANSLLAIERR
jgi:acetylornithine aminotransferase